MDIFFNSLQIYEVRYLLILMITELLTIKLIYSLSFLKTVMPLAFIVFHDHPETINKITESIKSAIGKTEGHSDHGCCTINYAVQPY